MRIHDAVEWNASDEGQELVGTMQSTGGKSVPWQVEGSDYRYDLHDLQTIVEEQLNTQWSFIDVSAHVETRKSGPVSM